MKTLIIVLGILLQLCFGLKLLTSQENQEISSGNQAAIFLDCNICDLQFIKESLTIVDYCNDPRDALIHVLITTQPAANKGTKVFMDFSGQHQLEGMRFDLTFDVSPDETEQALREALLQKLKVGLVPFLTKANLDIDFEVIYFDAEHYNIEKTTDPWKNWCFNSTFTGNATVEKSYSSFTISSYLSASKITIENKLLLQTNFYYSETTNKFYSGDQLLTTYQSVFKDFNFAGLYVKSMGKHFGIGGMAGLRTKSYNNLKRQAYFCPAVEYSIYDYENAARKQLCFLYSAGFEYSDYEKVTIYDRLSDQLFFHSLKIGFGLREKFGSVMAGFEATGYMHDFSRIDLGMYGIGNIKVAKGVAVHGSFNLSMPGANMSLPDDEPGLEDLITNQTARETNIRLSIGVGCSFWFGSKTGNVVNPRFSL